MPEYICQKYTDCTSCTLYRKQIFKYRSFPKGVAVPKERCSLNTIYFLISGTVRVSNDEHPDLVFHDGQFILQPIGSFVGFQIQDPTECILFQFEDLQTYCINHAGQGQEIAKSFPVTPIVMDMCFPLRLFISSLKMYLNSDLRCTEFLKAKRTELYYLLDCYYTLNDISRLYAPIYKNNKTFRYFVTQNYRKAKDVEAFARLGGYSTPTFRRLFKETFGEPAYQWMIKKKCQDIQNDLITTDTSISEICNKYGFESLSNFSHFCRANLGKSPRAIRNEKDESH